MQYWQLFGAALITAVVCCSVTGFAYRRGYKDGVNDTYDHVRGTVKGKNSART